MRRGPLYMMLGALMVTVMITLVKAARAHMSAVEVIFWRGLISAPLAGLFARTCGLRIHNWRLLLVRSGLGFLAMVCLFTAARGLAVADLSIIGQLQPLVIALLAPIALGSGERPTPMLWLTLAVGLIGASLILAPDLAVGSYHGVLALCGAIASAGAHVSIRGLMRTDDAPVVVFYFQLVVLIAALAMLLLESGHLPASPGMDLLPHVLGIGVTAVIGQMFITQAYAEDRAPVVAAAKYSSLLWAVVADLVAFAVLPGWNVIIGGGLIACAGLWLVFYRE